VTTEPANDYLMQHHPEYLYYSTHLDAHLHAVSTERIIQHHKPKQRLEQILANPLRDKVEQDLFDLCLLLERNGLDLTQVGVTGSLLIGVQQDNSDIDLVFYERETFHEARALIARLIDKNQLTNLSEKDWQEAYNRRSCTLNRQDYVWHERRKFNKGVINGRKFDLNLVADKVLLEPISYRKLGEVVLQANITEDWLSFDYPALYTIDHATVATVVCFIATYTGQAVIGETVEVSGLLEQAADGGNRIVVGSSREAPGQYIKVITCLS
jgi:predicted nucleotidyltransferase